MDEIKYKIYSGQYINRNMEKEDLMSKRLWVTRCIIYNRKEEEMRTPLPRPFRIYERWSAKCLYNKHEEGRNRFIERGVKNRREPRTRGQERKFGKNANAVRCRSVKEGAKSSWSRSYRKQDWSPAGRFVQDKPRPFAISNLVVDGA